MGRNHNLYGGVRIGAPMTFNDTLLDVADSDNGLPIRDAATRFRRSSTFTPSVAWRYEDAGPYDTSGPEETDVSDNDFPADTQKPFMSPDGSTLFVLEDAGAAIVHRIPTPSPYSVSNLDRTDGASMGSFVGKNGATIENPRGLWFSRDGQYMFISDGFPPSTYGTVDDGGATGQTADSVHRYTAITPWVSYNTTADQMIAVRGATIDIIFDPTGKHFFAVENNFIDRYDLGTAYDFTTLTNPSISLDLPTATTMAASDLQNIAFSQDGYRMVVKGNSTDNNRIRYYPLSTPFDPTTIGTQLHAWTQPDSGTGREGKIMMTEDGAHLYVNNTGNEKIYHLSIPSEGGSLGQDPVIGTLPP